MEMLLRLDEREDLSPESTAARLAQPIAEHAYGRAQVEAQGSGRSWGTGSGNGSFERPAVNRQDAGKAALGVRVPIELFV